MQKTAYFTDKHVGHLSPKPVRLRYGVDYTASNPYQQLLYGAVGSGVDARPASVEVALAEIAQKPGPMVYHLHWEDHALKGIDAAGAGRNVQALIDGLDGLVAAGARIVWTRHNRAPHDASHLELYTTMIPHLTRIASVIHVHSFAALEDLAAFEAVALEKTVVIAHGNYVAHYADWAAPAAREGIGFAPDNHVFLLFGRLGGYKQVALTTRAFAGLDAPHARLLIAGVPAVNDLGEVPDDLRITISGAKVPEEDVGRYFAAADTVLLPYRDCLTSGTALLAAGFSRGVLGTDVAGLRDVIRPGVSGILCGQNELAQTLGNAVIDGRDLWHQRGTAARRIAEMRDWAGPGRQWRELFCGLAQRLPAGDASRARVEAP